MINVIVAKVERFGFTLPECIQKGRDRIANSVDPDQTAPSDLGLHCLLRPICPNTYIFYGNLTQINKYSLIQMKCQGGNK